MANESYPKPSPGQLILDPVTKKIINGGGRPPGAKDKKPRLAKHAILKVFEKLGGIDAMLDWVQASAKNRFAFYVTIFPKLLASQSIDEASAKLASRPPIGRIIHEIVDPKHEGYSSYMVEGEAVDVSNKTFQLPPQSMDEQYVREAFSQIAQDSGADEDQAQKFAGEIPL